MLHHLLHHCLRAPFQGSGICLIVCGHTSYTLKKLLRLITSLLVLVSYENANVFKTVLPLTSGITGMHFNSSKYLLSWQFLLYMTRTSVIPLLVPGICITGKDSKQDIIVMRIANHLLSTQCEHYMS